MTQAPRRDDAAPLSLPRASGARDAAAAARAAVAASLGAGRDAAAAAYGSTKQGAATLKQLGTPPGAMQQQWPKHQARSSHAEATSEVHQARCCSSGLSTKQGAARLKQLVKSTRRDAAAVASAAGGQLEQGGAPAARAREACPRGRRACLSRPRIVSSQSTRPQAARGCGARLSRPPLPAACSAPLPLGVAPDGCGRAINSSHA